MREKLPILVLVLLLGAAVGCDAVNEYMPSGNGKAVLEERERLARQREAEVEREKVDGERAALRHHIEATCLFLESRLSACKRKVSDAKADRELLSARVRELSSATEENGRTPERNVVLSGLLADDRVNELAAKYMECDFRMVRLEYIEAMREANGMIRRRDEALSRNQEAYDKAVAGTGSDLDQVRLSVRNSAADLKRSIAALEKKERDLQRSVSMSSAVPDVRRRKEQELRDLSERLRRLHQEYDAIRANRESSDDVSRASQQSMNERAGAQRQRELSDAHVARQFADIKDPKEITSACEARTVGALMGRIIAAERDVSGGDIEFAIGYLRTISRDLDKLNVTALQRVRKDIDSRISKVQADK